MQQLQLYIEYHWGRRRPQLQFALNQQALTPTQVDLLSHSLSHGEHTERVCITLQAPLRDSNLLTVGQSDKTDADMLQSPTGWIDHYSQIRELRADGIAFETALYHASRFQHTQSAEWVKRVQQESGTVIQPEYPGSTEIRLNGTWQIQFTLPVWEWVIRNQYAE